MPQRTRPIGVVAAMAVTLALLVPQAAGASAVPALGVEGPTSVGQGEPFRVKVFLENVGDVDGALYVVDIDVPKAVELQSAGFADSISRGGSVTFDSSGRAIHPAFSAQGAPEIVEGKPGNMLSVSLDQLHETAFVGVANRLDADFVMAKDARPGRPVKIRVRGGFLRSGPTSGGVVTGWRTLRITPTRVTVEEVARSLASDPVFAAPSADPGLSEAEEKRLETLVADAATPIFLAVLPAATGAAQSVLEQLVAGSGLAGTFVALVGDRYRAASDRIPQEDLDRLLDEAGAGQPDAAPGSVLDGVVRGAAAYVEAPPGDDAQPPTTSAGESPPDGDVAAPASASGGGSATPWIVVGAVAGVLIALVVGGRAARRLGARRREQRLTERVREKVETELAALGQEIAELDLDVEMPDVSRAAKDAYAQAIAAYEESATGLREAADRAELEAVARTVAGGRGNMAAARAELA